MAVHRNLLFTDTETLGLDPNRFEVIEIGAVLTTPDGKKVLEEFESKVTPLFPGCFEQEAVDVNGFEPKAWGTCEPMNIIISSRFKIATKFCDLAKGATLVGQNIGFDEGHILAFLAKVNIKPTWHYHKVDNAAMAWPMFKKNLIPFVSMKTLREFFQLPEEPKPHRALTGARAAREVYLKLMEYYGIL